MSAGIEKLLLHPDGSPRDPVNGFETEYSVQCETNGTRRPSVVSHEVAFCALGEVAPYQFSEKGFRLYPDGEHPEASTPEEISPLRSAHQTLFGHITVADAIKRYADDHSEAWGIRNTHLFANTCDTYGNSWSSHENISAARELTLEDYKHALAVHNLSRIVWSGAGFVRRTRSNGFQFCLSEKAEQIWDIANSSTVTYRPLVNLRDEPHADENRFRRIHGITGETVFSPTVNALRQASTAMILKACALGVNFDDLMPEDPIKAIRQISRDSTLKRRVRLVSGRELTGIELQLELAERSYNAIAEADYLTDQDKEWYPRWIELCEDLREDPEICSHRVDWVVKRNLIDRALAGRQSRGAEHSAYETAWYKAIDYHRLLPDEGMGMKLIRAGYYDDSPTAEALRDGLELPQTRALLRGDAIRRLGELGINFRADWDWITALGGNYIGKVILNDPYETTNPRLERALDLLAA